MKLIVFICILSIYSNQALPQGVVFNQELNDEWESFKTTFRRTYDPISEISRRLIWEENLKYIQQHNIAYDLGRYSYYLGINEYADMTHSEFQLKFLGLKQMTNKSEGALFMPPENFGQLPSQVDWRKKGYVTPVKNQGQCGSCWSFSATGSLEGQHFRKRRQLISLSEQQLVDCSGDFGNNGCNGGLMDNAFQYIQRHGIESEDDYPYTASVGPCLYNPSKVVAHCTGFVDIQKGSEVDLATAVASQGPISVAIDASHRSFQLYKGGIYNEINCSPVQLDHGVLVVGYNNNAGRYWLVKNSWGTTWGLSGYIKMSKDRGNQCGIASMASYPRV